MCKWYQNDKEDPDIYQQGLTWKSWTNAEGVLTSAWLRRGKERTLSDTSLSWNHLKISGPSMLDEGRCQPAHLALWRTIRCVIRKDQFIILITRTAECTLTLQVFGYLSSKEVSDKSKLTVLKVGSGIQNTFIHTSMPPTIHIHTLLLKTATMSSAILSALAFKML